MAMQPLCRIGVFYDGSYFNKAAAHLAKDKRLPWIRFEDLHSRLEKAVAELEPMFSAHRIVHAAWFQGLFAEGTEEQLKRDRRLMLDLLHAGVDPRFFPNSTEGREKGIDVSLAVDAVQVALERKIDVAALVTGDGDYAPLARTLMKQGVRPMAAYFEYQGSSDKGYVNQRLLRACTYQLDLCAVFSNAASPSAHSP